MLQPYKLQREPSYHQVVLDNKPKRLYFDLNPQEKPMLQPHELKKETNYHQAILDRKPKWSNFDQKLQEKPMLQPYELQKETNYYQEVIDARPKRSYSSNQYGGVHAGYVPGYQPTTHYVPRQESYRAGFAEIGVGYRGQPSGTRYQHYQRVLI